MDLTDHVRETLRPFKGSKLVVAVSGGLDSATLLDVLLHLREELKLTLVVAHADHGLRRASKKDAEFVQSLAAAHSLPFVETELKLKTKSNVEATARDARYVWLERIRTQQKADYIVTAHQADDQVETLFLHLARGSGLQGLSGMQIVSGNVLRPLLDVPRKDVAKYARKYKLKYRRDATNKDVKFARNRIRRQVITSLQKINPSLVETVSQSMRVFSDQYGVIQILAARELAQVTLKGTATSRQLDRKKLLKLERAVRHMVWREAVRELVGDVRGFTLRHFENLDELLSLQTGSLIHLPRGLTARRQYDEIVLRVGKPAMPPKPMTLPVPGRMKFGEVTLSASKVTGKAPQTSPNAILVDAEAIGSELRVRSPRPADRFKPAGMRGSKLVSDLLTDAKVPQDERAWIPVVTTSKRPRSIVWIAGRRADRRFAAKTGPKILLRVTP